MQIKAKYDGTCPVCKKQIGFGEWIEWERETKEAIHAACAGGAVEESRYSQQDALTDDNPVFRICREQLAKAKQKEENDGRSGDHQSSRPRETV